MTRSQLAEVWARWLPFENMRQSVRSSLDGIACLRLREDVDDRKFASLVRRFNYRADSSVVEHRDWLMWPRPCAPIVVNDLYVVRAVRNPRVYKCLRLLRLRKRRDRRAAHLSRVSSGYGRSDTRGSHISEVRRIFRFHLLYSFKPILASEHVELRGHAKLKHLPRGILHVVRHVHVRIEKPWQ